MLKCFSSSVCSSLFRKSSDYLCIHVVVVCNSCGVDDGVSVNKRVERVHWVSLCVLGNHWSPSDHHMWINVIRTRIYARVVFKSIACQNAPHINNLCETLRNTSRKLY